MGTPHQRPRFCRNLLCKSSGSLSEVELPKNRCPPERRRFSAGAKDLPLIGLLPREIPPPPGENAGVRYDAVYERDNSDPLNKRDPLASRPWSIYVSRGMAAASIRTAPQNISVSAT